MPRLVIFISLILTSACGGQGSVSRSDRDVVDSVNPNKTSRERMELAGKTVIVVQLDSAEIEQAKRMEGEVDFYIATDDLMWYNSIMLQRMDSLNIPVRYTDKDTIDLVSEKFSQTIMKDSTFSIYTYFIFDNNAVSRVDLFELLEW